MSLIGSYLGLRMELCNLANSKYIYLVTSSICNVYHVEA